MAEPAYIRVADIHKAHVTPDRTTIAVGRVTIDIARGSFVSIVGRLGCGKSTLLQIIAGLVPPTVSIDLAVKSRQPRDQITTRELLRYLSYRHRLVAQLLSDEGSAGAAAPA